MRRRSCVIRLCCRLLRLLRRLLMDACDACVKVGNKNDHAERAEDCFQCTRRTGCSDKPLQGKAKGKADGGAFTHLSTSLYALTALARDIVCLEVRAPRRGYEGRLDSRVQEGWYGV